MHLVTDLREITPAISFEGMEVTVRTDLTPSDITEDIDDVNRKSDS